VRQWHADVGDTRFRFDYDLAPDSLVLDLGGYEGQWASDLRCRIAVFEPTAAFSAAIAARFERNSDIRVFAHALGESTRRETLRFVDVAWFGEI
jgi:hypothetical protein